jgi:hypothetical protein
LSKSFSNLENPANNSLDDTKPVHILLHQDLKYLAKTSTVSPGYNPAKWISQESTFLGGAIIAIDMVE